MLKLVARKMQIADITFELKSIGKENSLQQVLRILLVLCFEKIGNEENYEQFFNPISHGV